MAEDAILIQPVPFSESPEAAKTAKELNMAAGATVAISIMALLLAALWGSSIANGINPAEAPENLPGDQVYFAWDEPEYMPRHEECIDTENGQDPGYEGYGIGYEPSLSIDKQGNLFVTAHKDLAWGGEGAPVYPIAGGEAGLWYACSDGDSTSWDYWASWFWISNDGGKTWGHGDNFEPTPGSMLSSLVGSVTGSGSECLGDEGDIAVDANDVVYFLDTTLGRQLVAHVRRWWQHLHFSNRLRTHANNGCR